jgi:hypothetical protein
VIGLREREALTGPPSAGHRPMAFAGRAARSPHVMLMPSEAAQKTRKKVFL